MSADFQVGWQFLRRAERRAAASFGGAARLQVILLLAGVLGLDSADKATVSAVASDLKTAFGIDNADIGLLVAATSFIGAIFTLPLGVLVDRISRRRLLVWAIALWTAAMIVSGFANSFLFLLLTRIFLGAVTSAAAPAVASLTGDFFRPRDRASVYGTILAGELAGSGFGFLVGGEVASWLGWRWSFCLMAVPSVILTWATWRFLPEPARGGQSWIDIDQESEGELQRTHGAHGESGRTGEMQAMVRRAGAQPRDDLVLRQDPTRQSLWWAIRYLFRIPTYLLLVIASALGYFFFAGVRAFGMIYLTDHWAISRPLLSALVMVVGLGAVVGVVAGGQISGWLMRRGRLDARIVVPGVALLFAVLFIGPAIWTRSVVLGVALLALGAGALAAANAPFDAARLDIVHPRLWGRAEAGRTALRAALEGGAPILFGVMSNVLGGGERGLEWTYLVMLIPVLAAASLAIPARRTYPRDVATAAASVEATGTRR